jgi:hypothetical protein
MHSPLAKETPKSTNNSWKEVDFSADEDECVKETPVKSKFFPSNGNLKPKKLKQAPKIESSDESQKEESSSGGNVSKGKQRKRARKRSPSIDKFVASDGDEVELNQSGFKEIERDSLQSPARKRVDDGKKKRVRVLISSSRASIDPTVDALDVEFPVCN